MMHVLMISLDPAITDRASDAFRRHAAYAALAGSLTIVAPAHRALDPITAGGLRVIPITGRRALYPLAALRQAAYLTPRPDLIVTQDGFISGLIGLRLRRRMGVPLLVQNHSHIFHNPTWLAEHPLRNRALLAVAGYVRARADFYRTVNRVEHDAYLRAGGLPDRCIALPLGTASRAFADPVSADAIAAKRAELGLTPTDRVALWVGYPVPFKRVPLLLDVFRRAAPRADRLKLVIIGDLARSADDLPAMAAAHSIADRVIFAGARDHADLPPYYQLADVYVHTSAYEGVPRVLFEAGAAGLPLVGMRAVGVDEVIIDGETGRLIDDGDAEGMAAALVDLLADPAARARMGAAARELCLRQFDADGYPARWVGVWGRAVELGRRDASR